MCQKIELPVMGDKTGYVRPGHNCAIITCGNFHITTPIMTNTQLQSIRVTNHIGKQFKPSVRTYHSWLIEELQIV